MGLPRGFTASGLLTSLLTLDEKLVFIFAWNEWAEGAYLEPDLKFKDGYLEETADAIKMARNIIENKY